MKYIHFSLLLMMGGCLDYIDNDKDEEEEKEADEDEEEREEGTQQGDCIDGIDNDNDSFIDCDDNGCVNAPVCNETAVIEPGSEVSTEPSNEPSTEVTPEDCNDGIDNEGDGLIDCDDPECDGQIGCIEIDCSDGLDDAVDASKYTRG